MLSLAERTKILARVCQLVKAKHFNPFLNGVDWDALVSARTSKILSCANEDSFGKEMHQLIAALKLSHSGFRHKKLGSIPARGALDATFQSILIDGSDRCMFQDVLQGGAAYLQGVRAGDLLVAACGSGIHCVADLTFRSGSATFTVEKLDGTQRDITVEVRPSISRRSPPRPPKAIHAFRLTPEVGLLKVTSFPGIIGIDIARDIDRHLSFLQGCKRLIVDLRGNSGGGIGGLRLMSSLAPGKLEVGYTVSKRKREAGYRKEELARFDRIPARKIALLWMLARYSFADKSIVVVTEGLGRREFHGRIVLLVNEHTASAGEMITIFAKENSLATIVGTKTAGRLLSSASFRVGRGYRLVLPIAAYFTWRGTMVENNGIIPDVTIPLSREALKSDIDTQLEKALEVVSSL